MPPSPALMATCLSFDLKGGKQRMCRGAGRICLSWDGYIAAKGRDVADRSRALHVNDCFLRDVCGKYNCFVDRSVAGPDLILTAEGSALPSHYGALLYLYIHCLG